MTRREPIVAREFDLLTPGKASRPGCWHLTSGEFAALREFALANREGDSPLELMRLCSPRGVGEAIQLQNYVGVIELSDGLQIEVLPKIDIAAGSHLGDREVFCRMLAELSSTVSFKTLDRSSLSTGSAPLFEVFVGMFLDEAADLVRTGLRSSYSPVEAEGRYVRGKIDFTREARKNPARADVISLRYDELLLDRPENRLVRSTLSHLRKASGDGGNIRRATQLLSSFEGVRECSNVDADLARCTTDRSTKAYGTLIPWCHVFLKGESFTMFRGESVATAMLFPMERIFEDYVGRRLRRRAMRQGLLRRVRLQATGQWLFNRRVSLRPDILCECLDGDRSVVLDTKWKRVGKPKDISVQDMHQMYAYGQRYRMDEEVNQHVVLLYPWHEGVKAGLAEGWRHTSIDGVQVDAFFVDIANIDESIEGLLEFVSSPSLLDA